MVPPVAAPDSPPTALNLDGLSVRIGSATVLDGIDLEVATGEWLSIIGPNGAGKSTLLRAVAGLVEHGGRIRLDGGSRRATSVALVPQSPVLPEAMTVAEYVLIGRTAHLGWLARESRRDREIVASVLRRLDLGALGDRPLTTLSGGEAQRAVVARALAQEVPLLLLDEPTSALDVGHREAVLELVDELRRTDGLTVVAAMHDLTAAARFSDRLALIDRGHLVRVGSVAHVLDAEILSTVYGSPLRVHHIDGEPVVLAVPRRPGGGRHEIDGGER